jgi:hypothetical protein
MLARKGPDAVPAPELGAALGTDGGRSPASDGVKMSFGVIADFAVRGRSSGMS